MYPNHQDIKKCAGAFLKAMKMKSKTLASNPNKTKSLQEKLDIAIVRLLTAGTIMKKFCESAKPRKRRIRATDDLELLLFEDPSGQKAPKQMNVHAIKEIRSGPCTFTLKRSGMSWKAAATDRCFAIFSVDPNGKEFSVDLEAKSVEEFLKWVEALEQLRIAAMGSKNVPNSGSQRNLNSGSQINLNSGSQTNLHASTSSQINLNSGSQTNLHANSGSQINLNSAFINSQSMMNLNAIQLLKYVHQIEIKMLLHKFE